MSHLDLSFGQDGLAALCRPRPVFPVEYHIQNELYGQHLLVKEYAGLPPDRPLPWAMEHAITFGCPEPYAPDAESPLPLRLAVTEQQADALRRGGAEAHAIGSAFFLMRALYGRHHGPPYSGPRRGTIVFPDKSTTHQETDYARAAFAERLAALPDEYQPVTASIFWRDWELGAHEPFARAGLRLVTSGHPYDPLFLFRQYDLCLRHRYACANDLSTSFCLSVLSGCRFFHLPTGPLRVTRGGVTREFAEEPTLHLPGKRACVAASPFPPPAEGGEQRRLAGLYAGEACVRPPDFFRELARRGRASLTSLPAPSADFARPCGPGVLAGWRAWGIDADGWARRRCGLVPPADARVEIEIHPDALRAWPPFWSVRRGGEVSRLLACPGPLSFEAAAGAEVEIEAAAEATLPEGRSRAFRVVRLERLTRPASAAWPWGGPSPAFDLNRGGMAGWGASGLDPDGWAAGRVRLLGQASPGHAAARLRLHVPPRPGRWAAAWSVQGERLPVTAGEWELVLSAGPGGVLEADIEAGDPVPLGADPRIRAFRLLSLRWLRAGALSLRRRPWWRLAA